MASAGLRIEGWRGESARRPPKRGKTEASEVRKTLISVFASTVVSRLDCSRHRPRRSRAGGRVSLSLSRLALGTHSGHGCGVVLCAETAVRSASRLAKPKKTKKVPIVTVTLAITITRTRAEPRRCDANCRPEVAPAQAKTCYLLLVPGLTPRTAHVASLHSHSTNHTVCTRSCCRPAAA